MLLTGIYAQLLTAPSVTSVLGAGAADQIFINLALKQAVRPYLVLNRVGAPPAGSTLSGTSDLIDGELQFDAYADTPQIAEQLVHAVRDYFMRTFVSGALPDGTTIQFVDVSADHDEPYEQGGTGYIYRALLRLKAFYIEHL